MTTLKGEIQRLRTEAKECCIDNLLLNVFDLDMCERIDLLSQTDSFVNKKRTSILRYLSGLAIYYDEKWKSVVDHYSEADTYIHFKYEKKIDMEHISEGSGQTPDFRFKVGDTPYYIELKTLHFAEAGLNYKQTLEDSREASIEMKAQIQQGRQVAFSETVIAPLHRDNKEYDAYSVKNYIERIIEKIEQNIKSDQFKTGDTFLLVDLKLVDKMSGWKKASVAVYQEPQYKSMVSGELWNIAFGRIGQPIFRAIEFEGKENIEGELSTDGILINHQEIKGLCFQEYDMEGSRKIVGFYRHSDIDCLVEPLHVFCDFTNDDQNSNAWRVLRVLKDKL